MQKNIKLKRGAPDWADFRYFLEVARTERLSEAARRMGVDYTTVSRRIRALEAALGTLLFDKSRATGFTLTAEGQRLLTYAEAIETTVDGAAEEIGGIGQEPSGHVRIGATEAFGIFFLTPLMLPFKKQYPQIEIDLLPVPRFISLSKREADIAITIERPVHGPYMSAKLCDYHLKLYGAPAYLAQHPAIRALADLQHHDFISYVDDLVYSNELLYLERYVETPHVVFRSTSLAAQHVAVRQGMGIGILPCFIGGQDPGLVPILHDELKVQRSFWLSCHEDLRKLRRIGVFWDFLRQSVEEARDLLLGN